MPKSKKDTSGPLSPVEFPPVLAWKLDMMRQSYKNHPDEVREYASAILDDVARLTADLVLLAREAQRSLDVR
jgi:hypothetical protein